MANKVSVIKDWYTAQELAGLPGMPETYSAVIRWAKKNLALSRGKLRGKGLEYAFKCLPAETQAHLTKLAVDEVKASVTSYLTKDEDETATQQIGRAERIGAGSIAERGRTAHAGVDAGNAGSGDDNTPVGSANQPVIQAAARKIAGTGLVPAGQRRARDGANGERTADTGGGVRGAGVAQRNHVAGGAGAKEMALSLQPQPAPAGDVVFDGSTLADREQAIAIRMVLSWVAEIKERGNLSNKAAAHTLLNAARTGLLPDQKVALLRAARDKRGRPSSDGLPSVNSIEQWLMWQRQGLSLVPIKPQPDLTLQRWHVVALEYKRRPQKPTTKMVWEQLVQSWVPLWGDKPPSYDQVAYFFREKYSKTDILRGQYQGSALDAKLAYQKRSSAGVPPFTEVHADGWNTHFTAPLPISGEFGTLEVWHFHELSTRYVSPPSIGLSESTPVILKGLENYIRENGVPAIWQTDSTGSVKNATVEKDPLVSLSARLGISIHHPVRVGKSQTNGIAENFNTFLDREARELATYQHPRMDSLAHKRVGRLTDKMVKAAKAGDAQSAEMHRLQAQKTGKGLVFQTFEEAVAWVFSKVDKFNNTPHSALPKVVCPQTGKRRHQTPREARDQALGLFDRVMLSEVELVDSFRLHFKRVVRRATVVGFMKQEYRHADLAHLEGEEVIVAVDVMDGYRVWVKDQQQRLVCEAPVIEAVGFHVWSFYEFSMDRRMNARIRRQEKKIEAIQELMDPARAPLDVQAQMVPGLTHQPPAQVFALPVTLQAQVAAAAPVAPAPAPEPTNYSDPRDLAMYLHGDRVAREEAQPSAAPISAQDERDALAKLLGYWDESDAADGGDTKEMGVRKSN